MASSSSTLLLMALAAVVFVVLAINYFPALQPQAPAAASPTPSVIQAEPSVDASALEEIGSYEANGVQVTQYVEPTAEGHSEVFEFSDSGPKRMLVVVPKSLAEKASDVQISAESIQGYEVLQDDPVLVVELKGSKLLIKTKKSNEAPKDAVFVLPLPEDAKVTDETLASLNQLDLSTENLPATMQKISAALSANPDVGKAVLAAIAKGTAIPSPTPVTTSFSYVLPLQQSLEEWNKLTDKPAIYREISALEGGVIIPVDLLLPAGIPTKDGRPTARLEFEIKGGIPVSSEVIQPDNIVKLIPPDVGAKFGKNGELYTGGKIIIKINPSAADLTQANAISFDKIEGTIRVFSGYSPELAEKPVSVIISINRDFFSAIGQHALRTSDLFNINTYTSENGNSIILFENNLGLTKHFRVCGAKKGDSDRQIEIPARSAYSVITANPTCSITDSDTNKPLRSLELKPQQISNTLITDRVASETERLGYDLTCKSLTATLDELETRFKKLTPYFDEITQEMYPLSSEGFTQTYILRTPQFTHLCALGSEYIPSLDSGRIYAIRFSYDPEFSTINAYPLDIRGPDENTREIVNSYWWQQGVEDYAG